MNKNSKVAMIVSNPCVNDTRVIKEAEMLADHGYDVNIFCRAAVNLKARETIRNVNFIRLEIDSFKIFRNSFIEKILSILDVFGCSKKSDSCAKYKNNAIRQRTLQERIKLKLLAYFLLPFRVLILLKNGRFNYCYAYNAIVEFAPDIVHVHDLSPLKVGVRICEKTGAKLIYDAHELERHRNGHGWLRRTYSGVYERLYIHAVAKVITVSNSIADYLARLYTIDRPLVVMNVPTPSDILNVEADIRSDIGLPIDAHLALYVGKITFGRGLEQVVEALPHCPEIHFALLGPKVQSTIDDISRIANELGVMDRVHIVDPVSPHEVVPYLRTADTGVVPIQDVCLSYRFCMPNKLFELAIAGIPVAVSNLPEMRQFIEKEKVGVVMDQTDPKDIARAIREAYKRKEELTLKGEALIGFKQKYSWEGQAEPLIRLYEQLTNKHDSVIEDKPAV